MAIANIQYIGSTIERLRKYVGRGKENYMKKTKMENYLWIDIKRVGKNQQRYEGGRCRIRHLKSRQKKRNVSKYVDRKQQVDK
jgi:hypothetical protein